MRPTATHPVAGLKSASADNQGCLYCHKRRIHEFLTEFRIHLLLSLTLIVATYEGRSLIALKLEHATHW